MRKAWNIIWVCLNIWDAQEWQRQGIHFVKLEDLSFSTLSYTHSHSTLRKLLHRYSMLWTSCEIGGISLYLSMSVYCTVAWSCEHSIIETPKSVIYPTLIVKIGFSISNNWVCSNNGGFFTMYGHQSRKIHISCFFEIIKKNTNCLNLRQAPYFSKKKTPVFSNLTARGSTIQHLTATWFKQRLVPTCSN